MPTKKQLLELEHRREQEKSRYIGRPSRGQFSNTFVQADDDHPQVPKYIFMPLAFKGQTFTVG